ncbi:MAG: hypothetical protein CM15mP30_6520 [Pelagibacteraceae bacterium]|nr:MAG: hypothetical protein CM15mP30_6520 [Pelagibacteraceae bacterium]
MLLYIVRYFFSLFVVILFCPFLLFAEDLIPEKFHGTWSNDCSKEQDVFIITESSYFNLYESQDEIDDYAYFYLQFSDSKTYKDWIYLDGEIFEFKNVFMKLNDDILEVVFEEQDNPDESYDFLNNTNNTFTYAKCDNTPASLTLVFGEVLSYMNSKASLSCSNFSKNKGECFEDVFSFLDVSGNKALSNAEINRASKLLVFFSTINGQEFDEAGLFGIISSYAITPLLTKVILNNFDFDNSADLTLEEILQDREGLFDLDFSENDQIEIDNQKINEQIRDFINKLQGLGSFL